MAVGGLPGSPCVLERCCGRFCWLLARGRSARWALSIGTAHRCLWLWEPLGALFLPQSLLALGQEASRPPDQPTALSSPRRRRHLDLAAVLDVLGQVIRQPDDVAHTVTVDGCGARRAGQRPPALDEFLHGVHGPVERRDDGQVAVRPLVPELDVDAVFERGPIYMCVWRAEADCCVS